jgi:disulfide oxidoreductase YuzD
MLINNCEELSINSETYKYDFSVCTLVTRKNEYEEMLETFYQKGFTNSNTQFLYIDNSSSNKGDGFAGLNKFLSKSQAKYTIICHQDIRLDFDDIKKLKDCIKEIENKDSSWAILGNAGGSSDLSKIHCRITDPHGNNKNTSNFPVQVNSLDENFLLVKNGLNIGLSCDLKGFHFYGTDICLQANIRGYTAYVIDFHLRHLSPGNIDNYFYTCKKELIEKYELALKPKFIRTSCTYLYISGFSLLNILFNNKIYLKIKSLIDSYIK